MKNPISPTAQHIANACTWFLALLVMGTITGVWVKLFWIGWVFAR